MIPVTRIDSLIHELGRYSVPFQLWGIWDFDGELDNATLSRAAECLMEQVPLLGCRLERGFFRDRFFPMKGLDPRSLVHFWRVSSDEELAERTNRIVDTLFDIEKGPGFALHAIQSEQKTRLILHLHHIYVDGRSTVHLMEVLADAYRKVADNPDYEPIGIIDQKRGLWQIVKRLKWKHWLLMGKCVLIEQILKSWVRTSQFEPLATDRDAPITGRLGTARFVTIELDPERVRRMREWCARKQAKINDFLMTVLIFSVHAWNREQGAPKRKFIPMVFAADMRRRYGESTGKVANLSTAHRFWVRQKQITDFDATAQVVKAGLDRMKKRGLGLDGIGVILKGAWIPGLFGRILFAPVFRIMANCMFRVTGLTNIGPIPDETGDFGRGLVASRCSIVVPIFPTKNLLFAATTYRGKITLEMGFDGRGLSKDGAMRFGKLVRSTIERALR